ncbi:adenylosuccinate synthase [Candidatus Curtissbacteria bacterium RIFCSPHIGHO2_01_FULL_41_11]|uniref:Adenylosuccinate synthetase n=1 Tax=Candidatus Curtissbacteria bacterium RIFCSPHIGHO2_01_FULL_41_11 TaxID=1797711 RepID=A0A1F5G3C7_9BACT|nr:MAG: adenylosuccinate synthase [Candidatus Curtissbacteria bacterium RIFCSPHIGHO2_01_FULL_41_11]
MKKSKLSNWKGVAAVIGVDWGDSGKGRLIDNLAQTADVVARFNGGSNTGHTVKNKFGKFALHIIPSGIFNSKSINIVGKNVLVDLESLIDDELQQLKKAKVSWKNLRIDQRATLVMPWHKMRDGQREESRNAKIGTTKRGVGPAYADRIERVGIRVRDLYRKDFKDLLGEEIKIQNKYFSLNLSPSKIYSQFHKYTNLIKPLVTETTSLVKSAIKNKKNVLFEGAQGYFLDVDAGTYPFVTSSNTGIIGIWRCFDVHPTDINYVIGITKAYTTRVGSGPMPTYIKGEQRDWIIKKGGEVGTTSGRIRDPGWLDLVLLKTACENNRVTNIAMTKLDVLSQLKEIKVCIQYKIGNSTTDYISGDADFLSSVKPVYKTLPGWNEDISKARNLTDLPQEARNFIKFVENYTKLPISFIGVGPDRSEVIYA